LVISLPISSKPSCNVASGSRFDNDSIETESSLESILATEKEPIDIQVSILPLVAAEAVLPVNYGTRLD
jgi:hypothetical protein